MRRFQLLLVAACIALQAIDGVVGALGHSRHDHTTAHVQTPLGGRHVSACSHGHDQAATNQSTQDSRPAGAPHDEDDGCSLCRHFSQPIIVVAVSVPVDGSRLIERVIAPPNQRIIAAARVIHTARGPPALSA